MNNSSSDSGMDICWYEHSNTPWMKFNGFQGYIDDDLSKEENKLLSNIEKKVPLQTNFYNWDNTNSSVLEEISPEEMCPIFFESEELCPSEQYSHCSSIQYSDFTDIDPGVIEMDSNLENDNSLVFQELQIYANRPSSDENCSKSYLLDNTHDVKEDSYLPFDRFNGINLADHIFELSIKKLHKINSSSDKLLSVILIKNTLKNIN